jgi:pyruvate kinase
MDIASFVRSKIICTIGPASETPETLKAMVDAGMDVARFNLSHSTIVKHKENIENLRKVADIAVLVDLPGPKIRVGDMDGAVNLEQGDIIHFNTRNIVGGERELPVTYERLPEEVEVGGSLFMADGLIEVLVTEVDENLQGFKARVVSGGEVSSGKGVNVPGSSLSIKPPTEEDRIGIEFGIREEADWFALSFVRSREDVETSRGMIMNFGGDQPIISKIEHGDAIKNIDGIIEVSDAIMVARGDLGIEVKPWEVPLLQKSIIDKCQEAGKPVIVATQMLESMVTKPRPTRAEASDVANAILDGADAIMLSEETAVGLFPVEAVKVMNSISMTVEETELPEGIKSLGVNPTIADVIGSLVAQAGLSINPAAIIVVTRSGFSALMVSKHRPRSRILAITKDPSIRRRMHLYWGVEPLNVNWTDDRDELILRAIEKSLDKGVASKEDVIMVVSGSTLEAPGRTTTLQILNIEDILYYMKRRD